MNPSTSQLMENLVLDNELNIEDPIIQFLATNSGWNDINNSDSDSRGSNDSDIEVLIEEHILLEKLKQVKGGRKSGQSQNNSDTEQDPLASSENNDITELLELKTKIEEAMQINLNFREDLLSMERKLVYMCREISERTEKKSKPIKTSEPKLVKIPPDLFFDSFRSPYFKFKGSIPPGNSDLNKLLSTITPILLEHNDWTVPNITSLCLAIRKFLVTEKLITKNGKRKVLEENIDFNRLANANLYELVKDRENTLNWKIIANLVARPVSAKDCEQIWQLHIKPSLRGWSAKEREKLSKIAKQYQLQNWDLIANELNTKRTGYECFIQHQSSFLVEFSDGKWTPEEEKYLSYIIEKSKIGNHISWDKINYFMDTKQLDQLYGKWHGFQAPYITKGHFTEREDKMLLGLIHKFGVDFKSVATMLKNRSVIQITSRYKDHLLPQLNLKVGEWTVEEDEKLLNLVKEHGEAKWAVIAKSLTTRSRIQIRHRYKLLKQKLSDDPDLNLKQIRRPKRPTFKKRVSKNKLFYSKIISSSGRQIKSMLKTDEKKQNKRKKKTDLKLTQYFQMNLKTEKVNDSVFAKRYNERNSDEGISVLTGESESPDLVSALIFSSIALRNFHEAANADDWSQKDRSTFHKSILELCSGSRKSIEDLSKWHQVFCCLLSSPMLLPHYDIDDWKSV